MKPEFLTGKRNPPGHGLRDIRALSFTPANLCQSEGDWPKFWKRK